MYIYEKKKIYIYINNLKENKKERKKHSKIYFKKYN